MCAANENEKYNKRKEKMYYDRSCRKRSFKIGDQVLLLLPTSNNKLLAEWKGPFSVVRKINAVDYVIRIGDNERTYHINMLKPFHSREENSVTYYSQMVQSSESAAKLNDELEPHQKEEIRALLKEQETCFSNVPGQIRGINYKIIVNRTEPINSLPYKIPFHLKEQVQEELDKWMKCGIIRKSSSAWESPIVVVKNSDSTLRITVDFRKLNPHVNIDNYPMPDRDSVIEKLSNAKYLSKLDLTKAYFQIPLDEESKKYTSFVTEFGQFEFNCVPFGIRFASGLCNRILKEILNDFDDFVTSFVDDLVIYSNDFQSHVNHLRRVFERLKSVGITLNERKCDFCPIYSQISRFHCWTRRSQARYA